jgi:hypothetical protein
VLGQRVHAGTQDLVAVVEAERDVQQRGVVDVRRLGIDDGDAPVRAYTTSR